jgi:hypothetical protein
MITFLSLVLTIPTPLLSEDITLRKGNEVICLSNIDSPIYLDPPFVGKHNSSANFLHLAGWDKDNWTIKNESEIIGPVIDKRWEGKVFLVLLRYKLRSRNWATLLPVTNPECSGV